MTAWRYLRKAGVLGGAGLLVGGLSACSLSSIPGVSLGLREILGADRAAAREPIMAEAGPAAAAPPAAVEPVPSPPAPFALAMQRAGSHYERGIQAMRKGNPVQAESEFDAALESLLASGSRPAAVVAGSAKAGPGPDWRWLSRLATSGRPLPALPPPKPIVTPVSSVVSPPAAGPAPAAPGPAPALPPVSPPPAVTLAVPAPEKLASLPSPPISLPAPSLAPVPEPPAAAATEEPALDAPALITPEDFREDGEAAADEALPAPEPEVKVSDFPVVVNEQVKNLLKYFQTKKWSIITAAFERGRRYSGMMRAVFRDKGLPEDLINLAFIESAVNPRATSRVKAAGIWQFMPATGRLYGMRSTWWVDERRDPEKSTRGAADYLKALYDRFGDWPLALAAYNAGEGTLQRAIDRQRTRDFWALRLPKETRLFVPAFMAMTIISRDPERYGFSPPDEEPFATEVVHLQQPTALAVIARAAGTSVEHIRELNPELVRSATPNQPTYALRIPHGIAGAFRDALAAVPSAKRADWVAHKVRKGETAGAIARRYGASLRDVLEMNDLPKRHHLKPGTTVLVPGVLSHADAEARADAGPARSNRIVRHRVGKGESLSAIARIYGVALDDLRQWNKLGKKTGLRLGQVLRVAPPEKRGTPAPHSPAVARR